MKRKVFTVIMNYGITAISFFSYGCTNCLDKTPVNSYKPLAEVSIHSDIIINESYIGNGAQWDPYQQNYGSVELKISDSDWQKLYARLDFMRPQFMRVMINTKSLIFNGKLVPEQNIERLTPILDYCQSRNVSVLFGDWGDGMVDSKTNTINETNLSLAAQYADYLIHTKGYSCIKYYNLINEPNGYWSVTEGKYPLWANAIRYFNNELKNLKLDDKLSLVGPDAAIWKTTEAWWVDSCATHLKGIVGLYDIHTYPSKITVNSGEYSKIIEAYKKAVPAGKKIVMGEIGFKYVEPADSYYWNENIRRAKLKPFASVDDSQMFVYDYMYGTDMADALIQTVNGGFSGSVVWMLDDAMHSKESPEKLKVWGFWNILGDEFFGTSEEVVRPWYYAWTLLTRYMPAGSKIYEVMVTGDPSIKAMAFEKDGMQTIALVNVSKTLKTVRIKDSMIKTLSGVKEFIYADGLLKKEGDHNLLPNTVNMTLDLQTGYNLKMPGESLFVYTNCNY
jgi:hypothetical protein